MNAGAPTRVDDPPALQARAMDQLDYIRATMERAASFTAVPGWGGAGMGAIALAAGALTWRWPLDARWVHAWLGAAALAAAVGATTLVRKSRARHGHAVTRPFRRFLLAFSPPVAVGIALTAATYRAGRFEELPAIWLLCYGAGVVTGGSWSIPLVPMMGGCFLGMGLGALVAPPAWGTLWMMLGFGLLHAGFGVVIARRHGG